MSQEILKKLAELKSGQDSLHTKVDALQDGHRDLTTAVTQSNEVVLAAIQALNSSLQDTRKKLRSVK